MVILLAFLYVQRHQVADQLMFDQKLISVNLVRRLSSYRIVSGAIGWLRYAGRTDWTRRCLWVTIEPGVMMFRGASEMIGSTKDTA